MDVEKYTADFWLYYENLEVKLIKLRSSVAFRKGNFGTCSDEIISLFLLVGAEIDHLCKLVCGFRLSDSHNMTEYRDYLLNNWQNIASTKITLKDDGIILQPFKYWQNISGTNSNISPYWWKSYNDVKHNRSENYHLGNLGNLLYAFSALYALELFEFKRIADSANDPEFIDVPPRCGEVFKFNDWKTRFSEIPNLYTDESLHCD